MKSFVYVFTLLVTTINSLFAMQTYKEWRASDEVKQLLQMTSKKCTRFSDDISAQLLDVHTEIWAEVCMQHYRENWEGTLPIMCTLCTLGYFLVQTDLLSRGNALASVEYVLDLLDSPEANSDLQKKWKPKFEKIQQALLALNNT
ncbi:MAG: hypothetical protein LBF43_01290 [Puniceicoccales bacterium]|jgi:hypothetical protein|nr:hypothetical protein [Puniceicoccales bacterium]